MNPSGEIDAAEIERWIEVAKETLDKDRDLKPRTEIIVFLRSTDINF
jgi:hypothetical protein